MYFEEFSDINQAIGREKEIKSMTRRQKIKLIESINPNGRLRQRVASASPRIRDAAAAALNEVKGLGAAGVPSLRSGRQEPPHAAATRGNDRH